MTVATPRLAATVVVVRARAAEPGSGFEVLLVRRSDKVAFMAGAYVFPGGRVDDADLSASGGDDGRALRLAAVRELEEEAGVRADPADLIPIAHWVTPEIEIKRYDTRFFLVGMPADQQPRHDEGETTALSWLTPDEAITQAERGEIMLPPPTWTTLKRMRRHRQLDDLFAWARSVAIPRVQPRFHKDEHGAMLMLPGDPAYPTIDGWEIPEDTRFVLEDGRWRPAKP